MMLMKLFQRAKERFPRFRRLTSFLDCTYVIMIETPMGLHWYAADDEFTGSIPSDGWRSVDREEIEVWMHSRGIRKVTEKPVIKLFLPDGREVRPPRTDMYCIFGEDERFEFKMVWR